MRLTRLTTTLAAALLAAACSTTRSDHTPVTTMTSQSTVVTSENASPEPTPIPGPIKVDREGRMYVSTAATAQTNIIPPPNLIPETPDTMVSSSTLADEALEEITATTPPVETRTRVRKD
jgi:hypothetical protein